MPNAAKLSKNLTPKFKETLHALTTNAVYVGIPQDRDARNDDAPINNATIGYLMDTGMPEHNVPARPWLRPGIASVQSRIVKQLAAGAKQAMSGSANAGDVALGRAGLIGQNGVKAYINAGISPALAESTLLARAQRGHKGAKQELKNRKAGMAPAMDLAKPLVDTGQLRNSITYVIRKK